MSYLLDHEPLPTGRTASAWRGGGGWQLVLDAPHVRDIWDEAWVFATAGELIAAFVTWRDGGCEAEPEGWYRHIPSGRRRPDGDASQEYVNP